MTCVWCTMRVFFHNKAYEDVISDMESRMYAYPQEIIDYLENDPKKPYLLCEYMHDMGNSLGGMNSYMDLLDRFEMYQGGFIWDYIDQALWVKDEVTGRRSTALWRRILMTDPVIMNSQGMESYSQTVVKNRRCRR